MTFYDELLELAKLTGWEIPQDMSSMEIAVVAYEVIVCDFALAMGNINASQYGRARYLLLSHIAGRSI